MTRNTDDTGQSRRSFLRSAAVGGLATGALSAAALAQDATDVATTFVLGGHTQGWEGYAPEPISGETNPTLTLQAGRTYRVVWQNLDGVPHNFAILDSQGNPLEVLLPLDVDQMALQNLFTRARNQTLTNVSIANATNVSANATLDLTNETGNVTTGAGVDVVQSTELISETDAVQALQFTATEEMARYLCQVHPTTMVGDVEIQTAAAGNATAGNATGNDSTG